jgi:Family of unknown function (DUF6084)
MSDLGFEVLDARAEPYAAAPTMVLRLRITERSGLPVHAMVLRCQIRIEPQRRRYERAEEDRLAEVFGERAQWADSLRPFQWTNVATTVSSFEGSVDVDLSIACTYDFEVASAKYFHALEGDEIPLLLLFSGTTFVQASEGLVVTPIAWHEEAAYRLPVRVWREMMDLYFPNQGWITLPRETLDVLGRYKVSRGLATWDQVIERLLKEAGEAT